MKTNTLLMVLFALFSNLSAFADVKQGDHVIYPVQGRISDQGTTYRVGTVVLTKGERLTVQEINHSSKYGGVTLASDENGHMVTSYGLTEVPASLVTKEVAEVTLRENGSIVRPGSAVSVRFGRGAHSTHTGRVIYAFENGQVAVISEDDYAKFRKDGDRIFNQQAVAVYKK